MLSVNYVIFETRFPVSDRKATTQAPITGCFSLNHRYQGDHEMRSYYSYVEISRNIVALLNGAVLDSGQARSLRTIGQEQQ
jgi:hypothetical protein